MSANYDKTKFKLVKRDDQVLPQKEKLRKSHYKFVTITHNGIEYSLDGFLQLFDKVMNERNHLFKEVKGADKFEKEVLSELSEKEDLDGKIEELKEKLQKALEKFDGEKKKVDEAAKRIGDAESEARAAKSEAQETKKAAENDKKMAAETIEKLQAEHKNALVATKAVGKTAVCSAVDKCKADYSKSLEAKNQEIKELATSKERLQADYEQLQQLASREHKALQKKCKGLEAKNAALMEELGSQKRKWEAVMGECKKNLDELPTNTTSASATASPSTTAPSAGASTVSTSSDITEESTEPPKKKQATVVEKAPSA